MISILKSAGQNSIENVGGVPVLVSAHRLMMHYTCIKFRENILNGFRVIDTQF